MYTINLDPNIHLPAPLLLHRIPQFPTPPAKIKHFSSLLNRLQVPIPPLTNSTIPAPPHHQCRIGSPIRPRRTADCAGANWGPYLRLS
ncbi:hypothetical protein BDP67DRAFT_515500 [Colletotrichum lupini]|nr:hypothetical protein BDP67DRAFT_515500 [Colletotrichum lupini]